MVEIITKKIEQLYEQIIFHEKDIEEYDGVCLASFTLSEDDESDDQPITGNLLHVPHLIEGTIPILKGWEKLQREITNLLDEGYLGLIQFYQELDQDIATQIQHRYRIAYSHLLLPHSSSSYSSTTTGIAVSANVPNVAPNPIASFSSSSSSSYSRQVPQPSLSVLPLRRAESEEEGEEEVNEQMILKRNEIIHLSILHKELRFNLRRIHELLSEVLEEKLFILQRINRIIEYYRYRIIEIGSNHGVRQASRKLEFLLYQKIQTLLSHRFFLIHEEESRQQSLQSYWSSLYLGSDKFMPLAAKALAKSQYYREAAFLDWTTYLKIGAVIMLLLWSITECLNNESYLTIWNDPTFAVFVCFGDLLLLLLMWALSMYVWKSSGIDFIRLLQLQDTEIGQSKYPIALVVKSFTDDCLIFLLTFILFNKIIRGAHRGQYRLAVAHIIPVLLTMYYCYRFFQPFSTRKKWLYMLWKVICAPCYAIEFRDGYIGDLLTSLVRVSVPFLFSLLYLVLSIIAWITNNLDWAVTTSNTWWSEYKLFHFGVIPWLMLYPLWIRLVQCLRRSIETSKRWPHYANALKYTSALLVISYGSFQPELRSNSIWVFTFVCATVYQFLWDIFQDWGMIVIEGIPSSSFSEDSSSFDEFFKHIDKVQFSFRKKRLLGPIWIYVFVMIFNLAFRFAWTLTLLPPVDPTVHGFSLYSVIMYHIGTLIAALEIVRRMVWGFFRLEFEQIEMMKKTDLETFMKESRSKKIDLDESVFDKMDVSGGDTQQGFLSQYNYSSILTVPSDWTAYLPTEVMRLIDALPYLQDRQQKVILVECIFSASIVLALISNLALHVLL